MDNEEGNDELARARMGAIRDQLQEAADLDVCKKTAACLNNDSAMLDMVVKAATLVMKERNELPSLEMHDADGCIKSIKSVATVGIITSNDIARCDVPSASSTH